MVLVGGFSWWRLSREHMRCPLTMAPIVASFSTRQGTKSVRFERPTDSCGCMQCGTTPSSQLLAKAGSATADEVLLHEFAALADELGSTSTQIDDLRGAVAGQGTFAPSTPSYSWHDV